MKIYFFEENIDRMGGVERIVSLLANSLSSDYDVKVVSLKKTRDKEFFTYSDCVKRIYIDQKNFLNSWHNNKNLFKKKFYSLYYRINNFFLNFKKKKLFKEINQNDILIFGRIQVALKWLPFLDKNNKIIIRDANHYYCNDKKNESKIIDLLNNYVNLLIVSSDESKAVYEKLIKSDSIKIKKIYNPLGITSENLYNYDAKKIVAVGRYDSQKGFDVLLKSFKIVEKKHNDWHLTIVGPKYEDLESLLNEMAIKNVQVISEQKDIKNALKDASLYVMTSRYEGYANSLVEALACGIPSISFNWLLGVDEIIDDKENGEIVKLHDRFKYFEGATFDDDIESLASTISKLIENKKLLDKYSKNALKIVDSRLKDKIVSYWKKEIERIEND